MERVTFPSQSMVRLQSLAKTLFPGGADEDDDCISVYMKPNGCQGQA